MACELSEPASVLACTRALGESDEKLDAVICIVVTNRAATVVDIAEDTTNSI